MKIDIMSVDAIPSGKQASPEMKELYKSIGALDINQALRVSDKTEIIERIRQNAVSYYSTDNNLKKFGFKISTSAQKDVPAPGYTTLWIKKVIV